MKKISGILKATSNGLRQQYVARRAVIKVSCSSNIVQALVSVIRPKHSREILRFGSHNIFRSLLGEGWYFRLRIRVSAYPLHNILLRSLLGEGWYFRLRIRVFNSQYT